MKGRGTTVLYTTHYMEEAQELSDHIAILDHGQLIALGTHAELVRVVGGLDRITLTLSAESPLLLEAWRQVRGVQRISSDDGSVGLLVEDSNQVLPRLFDAAADHRVRITSVDILEPNLEAVFLHLTGRALRD
jgi:ABC-2 type transport system ATP-binding protein